MSYKVNYKEKVKKPCISCKYFKVCGSTTRTEPCDGRELKTRKGGQKK